MSGEEEEDMAVVEEEWEDERMKDSVGLLVLRRDSTAKPNFFFLLVFPFYSRTSRTNQCYTTSGYGVSMP